MLPEAGILLVLGAVLVRRPRVQSDGVNEEAVRVFLVEEGLVAALTKQAAALAAHHGRARRSEA